MTSWPPVWQSMRQSLSAKTKSKDSSQKGLHNSHTTEAGQLSSHSFPSLPFCGDFSNVQPPSSIGFCCNPKQTWGFVCSCILTIEFQISFYMAFLLGHVLKLRSEPHESLLKGFPLCGSTVHLHPKPRRRQLYLSVCLHV